MTKGRLLALLALVVGVTIVAVAGYGAYLLYAQRQAATAKLKAAQATLLDSEQALSALEAEHERLEGKYEAAKDGRQASEQELSRVTHERGRLKDALETLSHEYQGASGALKDAKTQVTWLEQEQKSLKRTYEKLKTRKNALEDTLNRRDRRSLTRAELEQLSQYLADQKADTSRLEKELSEISESYERLAYERRQLEEAIAAHPPEEGSSWAIQLADRSKALSSRENTIARHYKELGEGYLRMRDYAHAAEAFERSLELRDDPELHTRLAFLYSRFLHNGEAAGAHAAKSHTITSVVTPGAGARVHGMPRSGWRVLWNLFID